MMPIPTDYIEKELNFYIEAKRYQEAFRELNGLVYARSGCIVQGDEVLDEVYEHYYKKIFLGIVESNDSRLLKNFIDVSIAEFCYKSAFIHLIQDGSLSKANHMLDARTLDKIEDVKNQSNYNLAVLFSGASENNSSNNAADPVDEAKPARPSCRIC